MISVRCLNAALLFALLGLGLPPPGASAGVIDQSCAEGCEQRALPFSGILLAQAATIDPETLQKFGTALGLGSRASQFPNDIAAIRDAVVRGDKAATVAAIQTLYKKAGFLTPVGDAMDKLVSALPRPTPPASSASGGTVQPQTGTQLKPPDAFLGDGSGAALPLGQGAPSTGGGTNQPVDPYKGSVTGGPTLPLGQGASSTGGGTNKPVDPNKGSVTGGPTLPLGQGAPSTGSSGTGSTPTGPTGSGAGATAATPVNPDDSLLGPPPTPTVKLDPCGLIPPSSSSGPVAVNDLIGVWSDSKTGEQIEIEPDTTSGRAGGIVIHGKHNWWNVSLQGQMLKACRTPLVEEMGDAPEDARKQAYGKIKWELELNVTADRGQLTLDGKWYPGSFRWTETPAADASRPPNYTVGEFGRGKPIDTKYIKPPPAISDVIVLTDQTTFVTKDLPKWPYATATGDQRVLFVYGRGLPRRWSDTIQFKSEDPSVTYMLIAMSADKATHPARKEILDFGWREARRNLDDDTIRLTQGLDALLVYARFKPGVLPGTKRFTLNGADGAWRLRFGDDRASISFMRAITEDIADPTGHLILPERVFLEVRTGAAFPIDSIPLKVALNGLPISWGGAKTIEARRVEPTVYRTDAIELVDSGRSTPATEKGVFFIPAQVNDEIRVRLEDPFLLGVTPASTVVKVLRTPGDLGTTWKEALLRAAKADGLPGFADDQSALASVVAKALPTPNVRTISDWNQLTASEATAFTNYELSPVLLKTLESATPLKFLRYVPSVYRYIQEIEKGKLRETTKVTVGDHAALLLFRDEFVKSMTAAADNLDKIKGEAALRGFREAIKLSAWDDDSPWRYLRISCSDGSSDCSFPMMVSDSYLEQKFGLDRRSADAWVRKAVDEAIQKYRQSVQDAIKKAKDLKDNDVKGLLKLVGVSYLPLLPPLQARMMRLVEINSKNEIIDQALREKVEQGKATNPALSSQADPVRQRWIPDLNGRYELRNLHTVVEALQAQEDYSKLDTQMAMLMAAATTAPFIMGEGVVAAAIAWGMDATYLGISLANDVPEFIEQREEIHFALGASIILGTQRLQEAELKKTEWFQLVGQLGPTVLGPIASTVRMVGVVRSSLILSAVERGGLKAFETLSAADKAAFWRYATEAELLQELGETKTMTVTHRRALAVTEKLLDELGVKAPELPKTKTLLAVGEPGPASLPKTKTLKASVNAADETVEVSSAGELVGEKEPAKPEPSDPAKAPPEKEPAAGGGAAAVEKTPTVNYGTGEVTPRVSPPRENAPWATTYNGKIRNFKLGAYIGGGEYSQVFELLDSGIAGCEKGCVIKIVQPDQLDLFFGNVNVVENIRYSSGLVDDAKVFQLRNLDFQPNAPMPYFIQEAKQANQAHFKGMAEFKAAAARIPGLRKAVVDLATQLRNNGLIWEDMKVANMFFAKDGNGEWIAGVLDHDRIIRFADRNLRGNMGAWMGCVEADIMPSMLKSMKQAGKAVDIDDVRQLLKHFQDHPGPYFRDIDLFWEKVFEYKAWIEFDEAQRTYVPGGLTPDDIEKNFPRLMDRTRLDPFEPGIEFNKPRGAELNILPFVHRRLASLPPAPSLARAA